MSLIVACAYIVAGSVGLVVFTSLPFYNDFEVWLWLVCILMDILSAALTGYGCNEWERINKG